MYEIQTKTKAGKEYWSDWFDILIWQTIHFSDRPGLRKCQFKDDDDCLFSFTYEYLPNGDVEIVVQRTKCK